MKPTKEFLEKTIQDMQRSMQEAQRSFERSQGVVNFCNYMLENKIFVEEEKVDGTLVNQETAGR